MKRTNYAIIALFLLGFVMIYVMFLTSKTQKWQLIEIEGEETTSCYSACKSLGVVVKGENLKSGIDILVEPSNSGMVELSYRTGWNEYLKVGENEDTLKLFFDFERFKKDSNKRTLELPIKSEPILIKIPVEALVEINMEDAGKYFGVVLRGINSDSLKVSSEALLTVQDCNFHSLDIESVSSSNLESGSASRLYMNPANDKNICDAFKVVTMYYNVTQETALRKIALRENTCDTMVINCANPESSVNLYLEESSVIIPKK